MATAVAQEQQQQRAGSSLSTPSPPPCLRVLDTTLVPPSPTGSSALPESSLPLTIFDTVWLHFPPVERLFLYRLAPGADVPAILSSLKDALSRALRTFYPLAGHLRLNPGTSDRYELHYRPGDGGGGVDGGIDGLGTDEPREVARIARLVPALPAGGAVLALQATLLLPARHGLAIGVTVHHAAIDGSSSTHFLHTWAAAACTRSEAPPPPPPVIDRSLLPDAFFEATSTTGTIEVGQMPADELLTTFTLSKDDLQRVKDAVAGEAARRGVAPPRCTSLVATLGFVWSCYQRAKEAKSLPPTPTASSGGDGRTCLIFPVDHRSRMSPPLPDKYLGNCVLPAFAVAPKDALAAAGAAGLFSACTAIAAGIDEAVRGGVGTSSMDAGTDRAKDNAGAMSMLSVAGSPRFRVYELDLGFGRPVKVDIVSVARNGAVALAESRRGAGGMEVGVPLPPDGMERFRTCFADAIVGLQHA